MSQALVTANFPLPSVVGSLDAYISAVHRIPVLSSEEEQALSRDYLEDANLAAAKKLVMSHLRFVVHVARGYSGYGLQRADLIQEGNIGLMKAVRRFDPERGVRLVSFTPSRLNDSRSQIQRMPAGTGRVRRHDLAPHESRRCGRRVE